ncbi:MAG TPA: L,D-transpeptidase family protein [Candidatus Eremiobacteraeota bacterium]|nr:MAG: putative L,D-transpeptidase YnhG precursor [bacterium ADurb.Bin363]HPZ08444.1 L,D-transpeptidase family protein [Candidatus Eremiobacteraeota bacterium]
MAVKIDHGKYIKAVIPILIIISFLGTITFWFSNYNLFEQNLYSLNIKNNQYFNSSNITVEMNSSVYFHPFNFLIDSIDVTSQVHYKNGRASLSLNDLKDGKHNLRIYSEVNLYSMAPHELSVYFFVDTKAPEVVLTAPRNSLLNSTTFTVKGTTEPACKIIFRVNGIEVSDITSTTGYFFKDTVFMPGLNEFIITATDPAGNRGGIKLFLLVDNKPPVVNLLKPSEGEIFNINYVDIEALFTDEGTGLKDSYFLIDNKKIPVTSPKDGHLVAQLDNLDEGEYKIVAVGVDKAGSVTKKTIKFIIDTSETFGEKTLRPGARGQDIIQLQKSLIDMGYLRKDYLNGFYDDTTVKAVEKFQHFMNMPPSPVLEKSKLVVFCNKIRVYLDEFTLFLYSPTGKVIKSYPIACGSYAWPTPPGNYYIKEKQIYPTWYPPPSPWAAGLKPVPPGPDNPLGTRWMGLSGGSIGIHGTPSAWSIGYPDSHGCIRMYIADAEELYEEIQIGTPVDIYSYRPENQKETGGNGDIYWKQMMEHGFITCGLPGANSTRRDTYWEVMCRSGFVSYDFIRYMK